MTPIARHIILFAAAIAFASSAFAATDQLQVDPLKPADFVSDGAWNVWFLPGGKPGKIARIAEVDFATGELVVRVNGRVERLKSKGASWKPKREQGPRLGDRCEEEWANARVKARISFELVAEAYELSKYSGRIVFSANGQTRTIDVQGETGS